MKPYEALKSKLQEISHLRTAASLLVWDQEVMMPPGGAPGRAREIATISGLHHEKFVHEGGDCLKAIEDGGLDQLDNFQQLNYAQIKREHEKLTKLPKEHVMELSKLSSQALPAWVEARKNNDFSKFEPILSRIVELKIQEADYLGYEENPYDALIDQYEPKMKASQLEDLFTPFKSELGDLLAQIRNAPQIDDSWMLQEIPKDDQLAWTAMVVEKLGYDFKHGRQDVSAHPFTIGFNPADVRITTMVQENDIREMLYSSVHEAGHAIYEQGLPMEHYGLPASVACSLAIHESQSRLWENNVARDLPFWEHFFPTVAELFPDKLAGKTPEDVFRAVNKVQPHFIRISADELTYHFHIILRFEIENALINKEISVADLPAVWNEKVKNYLGLTVEKDGQGVLQDIHWSHGNIGYFPTYSLGSFYAAQFMEYARKEIPHLEDDFKKGEFLGLKGWLNEKIHQKGRLYSAEELCTMVTGEGLNVQYFINYAREKFGRVYGIRIS